MTKCHARDIEGWAFWQEERHGAAQVRDFPSLRAAARGLLKGARMDPINLAPGPSRPLMTLLVVFIGNLVFGAGWFVGRHGAPPRAVPRQVVVQPAAAPPVVLVPPPPAVPAPPTEPACAYPRVTASPCPVEAAIARIGDNRYLIHREMLDCVLQAPSTLAASARIVPSLVDGRPTGFKLYAVRPGSLFAQLGIQNGDRIERVNGMDLSTPDRCLEVYSRVRTADRFYVDIVRRGAPVRLEYVIARAVRSRGATQRAN